MDSNMLSGSGSLAQRTTRSQPIRITQFAEVVLTPKLLLVALTTLASETVLSALMAGKHETAIKTVADPKI